MPVPPPAAHPLPEGKELWKFLHSHNYIIQCHLQLCTSSQKVSNYMYVELSHSLLLQLHHPVPPPAAHPLPEGKELWKFLHSHNYIIQCHLQLCAPSQKVSNYMYVELSHSLLLQLHHPVPPPAAHPLPEGIKATMEISPLSQLHHPVPPPAVRPIPEGEQLHVCIIITFTALTITSSSATSSRAPPPRRY